MLSNALSQENFRKRNQLATKTKTNIECNESDQCFDKHKILPCLI